MTVQINPYTLTKNILIIWWEVDGQIFQNFQNLYLGKIEGQTFDHLMGVIKWGITVLTCLQGDLYKQIGVMLVLEMQIR